MTMHACLLALYLLLAPQIVQTDLGQIDYKEGVAVTIGVATPTIFSPTGGLSENDPEGAAMENAKKRLHDLIASLPINEASGSASDAVKPTDAQGQPASAEAQKKTFKDVYGEKGIVELMEKATFEHRHFTDGTVHVTARVPLPETVKK